MARLLLAAALALTLATAPGGAGAQEDRGPLSGTAGPYRVTVETDPSPVQVGGVRFIIRAAEAPDGRPVEDARVDLVARSPRGGRPLRSVAVATPQEPGVYLARLDLPAAGRWTLVITVETRALGQGRLELPLEVLEGAAGLGREGLALWLGLVAVLLGGGVYVWRTIRKHAPSPPPPPGPGGPPDAGR